MLPRTRNCRMYRESYVNLFNMRCVCVYVRSTSHPSTIQVCGSRVARLPLAGGAWPLRGISLCRPKVWRIMDDSIAVAAANDLAQYLLIMLEAARLQDDLDLDLVHRGL